MFAVIGRDRFHSCFFFWLLAALLVSLVPATALVLCAVHKARIELALIAGFNEAAVRYKVTPALGILPHSEHSTHELIFLKTIGPRG